MSVVQILKHQRDFIFDDSVRFLGLVGGYRSGKTVALCHKAIRLASLNKELPGAILEPTYGMIIRTLEPLMKEILTTLGIRYKYTKADRFVIYLPDGPRTIWLLSAQNYQRVAGMSLSWFCIDEIDLMKEDLATSAWNMLVSRLTRGAQLQGCCVSTPEGFAFLFNFFASDENINKTDRKLIRASTRDNPFITDTYIESLSATHSAKQLVAYIDGEFCNFTSGNVYYDFDRVKNGTHFTLADFNPTDYAIHIGIDFNVGKMATEVSVIEDNKIFVVDEIYGMQNTEALIVEINRRYSDRRKVIYCDGTGDRNSSNASTSDIKLLKDAGFIVKYIKGNPPIFDRVGAVNTKIKNGQDTRQLFVNPNRCPKLVRALEQQGFVNDMPDKSGDIDHPVDALGYFIYKRWPLKRHSSAVQYNIHI